MPDPRGSTEVLPTLLKQLRMSRRLRQVDLARLLQKPQSVVSRVESGERRLDVLELFEWLQAMNVDLLKFIQMLREALKESAQ